MGEDNLNNVFRKLTPRQAEIFNLVGEGKTSGEIADVIGISEKTVQNHRHTIMGILDLEGYGSLYHLALEVRLNGGGGNRLKAYLKFFYARLFSKPLKLSTIWVFFE